MQDTINKNLEYQAVLDGLGQAVLVFDGGGKLVAENLAARTVFGADLNLIRSDGWQAAAVWLNTRLKSPEDSADAARTRALSSARPVRFHTYHSGEYTPCWASAVHGEGGSVYTVITIDPPDWHAVSEILDRFRDEANMAIESTKGHADLITQIIKTFKPTDTVEKMGKRIAGFANVMSTHMYRLGQFMALLKRLETIRLGELSAEVKAERRKINLGEYFEDFIEELDEIVLVDPETDAKDYRSRLTTEVPKGLYLNASSRHLKAVLHDMLRNAITYSIKATPVKIIVHPAGQDGRVQIDVIDEGCGVRASEFEKVFTPFVRARQPQIISEFGYGLSLYLCKQEIEAMNGRMWFESEEGIGSTFSIKLPSWRETPATE